MKDERCQSIDYYENYAGSGSLCRVSYSRATLSSDFTDENDAVYFEYTRTTLSDSEICAAYCDEVLPDHTQIGIGPYAPSAPNENASVSTLDCVCIPAPRTNYQCDTVEIGEAFLCSLPEEEAIVYIAGKIRCTFCRTNSNLADFFTKGLPTDLFKRFKRLIMNIVTVGGG